MHPHLLHPHNRWALAAAWDLNAALTELETRAREAAADATAGTRDVGIPSQQFGRRTALGGHGDPTAAAALGAWAPGGPHPDTALLGDLMRQLDEMAAHLPGAPGMDPLTRIRQHIPHMRPHTAARTTQALQHLDGQARRRLHMPPDRQPVDGNPPCPACRLQLLYVQTSGPREVWTVICRTGCVCSGEGCGCGMPVRVEGVAHIWDRTAPIVAHALDLPPAAAHLLGEVATPYTKPVLPEEAHGAVEVIATTTAPVRGPAGDVAAARRVGPPSPPVPPRLPRRFA